MKNKSKQKRGQRLFFPPFFRLVGEQKAGWKPLKQSKVQYRVWSPYPKSLQPTGLPIPVNEVGAISYFVKRGYAFLIVNPIGMGKSEGESRFILSEGEQQDLYDTIEWAAMQSRCNGNAGMAGMAYFAITQYLVARKKPPHLKAIFP